MGYRAGAGGMLERVLAHTPQASNHPLCAWFVTIQIITTQGIVFGIMAGWPGYPAAAFSALLSGRLLLNRRLKTC